MASKSSYDDGSIGLFFPDKFHESWNSNDGGSKAILLPERKKSKDKCANKEENEKKLLQSESIRILEKYKISEGAYSLRHYSGTIGKLPRVYQDLLQSYIKRQCYDCKSIPEEPALCLLCGRLCSPSWKPCCRPSRCQNHALACGAGIGVFLLVRKTTILLQRSSRQAVWPSPYLDAFGEE